LAKADDKLTKTELQMCRKYTGKLSWLAANCHLDLAFTAFDMSKKNHSATIRDLKKINKVVERIRSKPSTVLFTKIGKKEDLLVSGLSDGSFKMDEKSVGGILVLLGNVKNDKTVPIYWKSKTIHTVCHSVKVAETCSMVKLMDDVQFFMMQIEQLLFGFYDKRIPIKIFTDSKPLLKSVGSIHQLEEKLLRNSITNMKDVLYDNIVQSFSWLDGEKDMVPDILTKECRHNLDLEMLVSENQFQLAKNEDNMVKCHEGEIKILNKHNKK
jgi:hypothetical protein